MPEIRRDPALPLKWSADPALRPDHVLPARWQGSRNMCLVELDMPPWESGGDRSNVEDLEAAAMAVAKVCDSAAAFGGMGAGWVGEKDEVAGWEGGTGGGLENAERAGEWHDGERVRWLHGTRIVVLFIEFAEYEPTGRQVERNKWREPSSSDTYIRPALAF
ncbi:MAG: hypothetical protein LQ345_001883 [Seirophora villosa]|nr:MAG: hypothetical protein LQ345_001883 [Seirophora villosa]